MQDNEIQLINNLMEATGSRTYIKLIKNTKGYSWEVKVLHDDVDELEKLNNKLINKFGGDE